MKENFITVKQQLPGICRVVSDFYAQPQRRGSVFFVKSPVTHDKTASLALYPNNNRFCDFANGNKSGDCISFVAYIRGCNQWEALKELQAYYGLSGSRELDREETRRRIQLQRQEEKYRRERQQTFETALFDCVDILKHDETIYKAAIGPNGFKPFSDLWCNCVNKQNHIAYMLDILCAIGTRYLRLKSKPETGCPSDHPAWLLDVLEVLEEYELFTATSDELKEITAQRDFELTRQPGKDRVSKIHWWRRGSGSIE